MVASRVMYWVARSGARWWVTWMAAKMVVKMAGDSVVQMDGLWVVWKDVSMAELSAEQKEKLTEGSTVVHWVAWMVGQRVVVSVASMGARKADTMVGG